MPADKKPERQKAFATRARTGCNTCRRAHRRCDESKPVCQRCARLQLACGYPQPKSDGKASGVALSRGVRPLAPAIRHELSPCAHIAASLDPLSTLYFDYFKCVVVSQLCTQPDGPTGFWSTTLLRECTHDLSVLNAVIGIGALSRARHEALYRPSLQGQNGVPEVLASAHYTPAVQHYSKAIASFRQRINTTASHEVVPARTLLVYTILFSIFETLHGNTSAFDHLVANGLRLFHGRLLGNHASPHRDRLVSPRAPDDSDVYDAECFLTRTATWSAIFSPMYPQSRQVLASMAAQSSSAKCELLLGPPPPDRKSVSVKGFWQTWWQFITRAVLWHLRARTILDQMEQRQKVDTHTDDGNYNNNNNNNYGESNVDLEDPIAAVTLAQIEEEQRLLVARSTLWRSETKARLDEIVCSGTTKGNCARDAQIQADKRILTMMIFDVQICHLSGCFALDSSEDAWSTQSCLDECNAALDVAQDIVADLTGPSSDAHESIMSDGLLIGLLQLARECRESRVRWRAFGLALQLVLRPSTRHVKSFVLGMWACIQAEEKARERGTGRIPMSHRYYWTAASWDEGRCALHVTITSREPETPGEVRKQESLLLGPEIWKLFQA
ncbi:uncharacterized protein B0I36DRAFT_435850 [Microdochium trichocladiopsis]|uniref:Zn(2)-C6 fungal-type domain-containing protein n=1 Tax=Microdochium trichocladiopsis TaxID=1682393 RepID=A0A9P9BJZ0_9PEZI|nr:uncharacterized protein B0I36DRAFT_435850 [Microdochium trichocladiopsis]KAH7018570.1 hypothetical protein B0I36DRAFT_435850 [Microdochium trichocladiopsis]